ncbi:F-box only protein 41-like isoform X2 [Acanthaster planci]|uniref:F-box only protein 41-like isoform X2 n=1 Tax=Acanthaster planci TaxID=133434 RepID=A0A8B7YEZ0_ACAPL|nr:F-box only protein 41-like isoform X2 [Acanthaster planci]
MEAITDYDWLFPKGHFSHQARILETHLLYSGSLSENKRPKSAEILQSVLLPSSHCTPRNVRREQPNHSLTAAKRELVQFSAKDVLPVPRRNGSLPRPEDHLLISQLRQDLHQKEREASRVSQGLQKETLEGVRLRSKNQELGRQLEQTLEQIGQLEAQLGWREKELASKEKAVTELNRFLEETAEKQAQARTALKIHMEELIQRAESAENEIATLRSTMHHNLQPASSLGTLNPLRVHHDLHRSTPSSDIWQSTDPPTQLNKDWQTTTTASSLLPTDFPRSQTSALRSPKQHLEVRISPALSLGHDPNGYHRSAAVNADSGVGSLYAGNQPSTAGSDTQLVSKSQPYSSKEGLLHYDIPQLQRSYNLSDKSQSSADFQQIINNSHGTSGSRHGLQTEALIEPSVNPTLLQSSPAHQSDNSPAISHRSWDLNFLNEVMEDVLKNREARKHLDMSNPSSAGLQPGNQANVRSLHTNQLHSPLQAYRPDARSSSVNRRWSTSDYDDHDYDYDTDETNSIYEQKSRSNIRVPPKQDPHWQAVWLCVFTYLDTETLLTCAEVCRGWRTISKHPSLWQIVRLANHKISSKFLQTISQWSKSLEHLHLEGLKPRSRIPGESREKYAKNTRGSLESGLEYILIAAGARLITLKIVDCSNILTERSLFLASCYCRNLYSLSYISQTDPIGHEVIWALGAGCRNIASLKVPPRQPCPQHQRLSNRCLQMIGRCWPLLLALSVGGPSIDIHGLVSIARNCPRLQVLELDHLPEVTEVIAIAMCQAGLRGLHTLILRNTLISPNAIMQFNGACPQLKALSVYLSPSICRGDNKDFHNIVSRLRALTKRRVLSDVLHVFAKFN